MLKKKRRSAVLKRKTTQQMATDKEGNVDTVETGVPSTLVLMAANVSSHSV